MENLHTEHTLHEKTKCISHQRCVKIVRIRSFSGQKKKVFWSVFSRIRTEYGEILRFTQCKARAL